MRRWQRGGWTWLAGIPVLALISAIMKYLLTWNCRHIANAEIQRSARRKHGFELRTNCTPEELMGEEE